MWFYALIALLICALRWSLLRVSYTKKQPTTEPMFISETVPYITHGVQIYRHGGMYYKEIRYLDIP